VGRGEKGRPREWIGGDRRGGEGSGGSFLPQSGADCKHWFCQLYIVSVS